MNHNLLWKPKSFKKNVEKVLVFERCKYIYIYELVNAMDNYRNPKAVLIDTCQRLDLFKWNRLFLLIIFLCSTHMYNSLLYINGKRLRSIARPVPVEIQLYLQWQPQLFTHGLGARSVELVVTNRSPQTIQVHLNTATIDITASH